MSTPPRRGPVASPPSGVARVLDRLGREYDIDRFVDFHGRDPFRVLVGCVLSLRTKDEVSFPATERLFGSATSPSDMLRLAPSEIERAIYPCGFYRRKTQQIREISRRLIADHDGRVPSGIDELLRLPGVGRKTANLVVTLGFGLPGICVDTHVHRITNRLGWVRTGHPDETETELRRFLPPRYWIPINETLVRHGQVVCHPTSPKCSVCAVSRDCARAGVVRSR
jgi:endonuclease-3